jgi:hypothetical protein
MTDGQPFVDTVLNWLRHHDLVAAFVFAYLVAFVLATSVYMIGQEGRRDKK